VQGAGLDRDDNRSLHYKRLGGPFGRIAMGLKRCRSQRIASL
jgi:hypothetical protein